MDSQAGPAPPRPDRPLIFVVLRHEGHGRLHFDLLLEIAGQERLAAWRVFTAPDDWQANAALEALRLADHRRIYLTYEGPVSGSRGSVVRVLEGTWEPARTGEKVAGVLRTKNRTLSFALSSATLTLGQAGGAE